MMIQLKINKMEKKKGKQKQKNSKAKINRSELSPGHCQPQKSEVQQRSEVTSQINKGTSQTRVYLAQQIPQLTQHRTWEHRYNATFVSKKLHLRTSKIIV